MATRGLPVAASLFRTRWRDLSDRHEDRRETLEARLEAFPEAQKALYIVGAIGSGKTELLYHGFRYTWTETNRPALCVTMSQLLDDILEKTGVEPETDQVSQAESYQTIETICFDKLEQIADSIEEDGDLSQYEYLPAAPADTRSASAYFGDILDSDFSEEDLSDLAERTRGDYFDLYVDEMEETYGRLDTALEGNQGPLREVVNRIAAGTSSFYLVGSFAFASIQELGQAENRRTQELNLPIIRPGDVDEVLGSGLRRPVKNRAWWAGRGRPGWLSKATEEVDVEQGGIDGLFNQLDVILPSKIANVDLLATQAVASHLDDCGVNSAGRNLMAYLLLNPGPTPVDEFNSPEKIYNILKDNRELPVYTHEEMIDLDDVLDIIIGDVETMALYTDYGEPGHALRQYLKRVLEGICDENNQLVFGDVLATIPNRIRRFKTLFAEPITERAHDIALEETKQQSEELEFFYQLSQRIGNLETGAIDGELPDSINQYSGVPTSEADIEYLSVSIETLRIAFPSLITNPIMNFRHQSRSRSEQIEQLADRLGTIEPRNRRLADFGKLIQGDLE